MNRLELQVSYWRVMTCEKLPSTFPHDNLKFKRTDPTWAGHCLRMESGRPFLLQDIAMLTLRAGALCLEIDPDRGAAIRHLIRDGVAVMRPTPDDKTDALDCASFPLVPFCNRIRDAEFSFQCVHANLEPTPETLPHALHGHGWRRPWKLEAAGRDDAVLGYRHSPDGWPWAYEARLVYRLRPDGLHATLTLKNLDTRAMPGGLGFHPYFNRTPLTRLKAEVDGVWMSRPDCIPTFRQGGVWRKNWPKGDVIDDTQLLDHCHTGFMGKVEIFEGSQLTLTMTSSANCHWLHLFAPVGADYFCAEPVSHMPDPFNQPNSGLWRLAPGEEVSVWMDIKLA